MDFAEFLSMIFSQNLSIFVKLVGPDNVPKFLDSFYRFRETRQAIVSIEIR